MRKEHEIISFIFGICVGFMKSTGVKFDEMADVLKAAYDADLIDYSVGIESKKLSDLKKRIQGLRPHVKETTRPKGEKEE